MSEHKPLHLDLIKAIRNDHLPSVKRWVMEHSIDTKFTYNNSDLISSSDLVDASLLTMALFFRKENIAIWAIERGAKHQPYMWKNLDDGMGMDFSPWREREYHPLYLALKMDLPNAVLALAEQDVDLHFRQRVLGAEEHADYIEEPPLGIIISKDRELSDYCEDNGLSVLLDRIDDTDFDYKKPRNRMLRVA